MIQNILLIEDDEGVRELVKEILLDNNYSVRTAVTGAKGLKAIEEIEPDLIVLDLGLPDITGESICKSVRKSHPHIPVIILTAKDGVDNVVEGLNLGADDYVTKPFEADELMARIKARLRSKGESKKALKVADLELDTKTMEVCRAGKKISLTPQEYKLLHYLMSNKNQVLTRDMILNRIWLYSPNIETRVVDVYVGYLRKKIDKGYDKKLIQSMRGFGYSIREQ